MEIKLKKNTDPQILHFPKTSWKNFMSNIACLCLNTISLKILILIGAFTTAGWVIICSIKYNKHITQKLIYHTIFKEAYT